MQASQTLGDAVSHDRPGAHRAGVNRERILDAAADLVGQGDLGNLTCSALAGALHIRPPSLYKHFAGLDEIRDGLAVRALRQLTELARAAISGRSGREAVEALADAQRVYAHAHPGLYAAVLRGPGQPSSEASQALAAFAKVELDTLRAYGLSPDEGGKMARCLRAAIRGFISLELSDQHTRPYEIDQSFDRLIDTLDVGARTAATVRGGDLRLATTNG